MNISFGYIVKRLRQEYYSPTTIVTMFMMNTILSVMDFIYCLSNKKNVDPIAIYDLRICAVTFDLSYFMFDAETYFLGRGFDSFKLIILNIDNKRSEEYERVINQEKRKERVTRMLIPMAEMYSACRSVEVTDEVERVITLCRNSKLIYPPHADGRHLRCHHYVDVYAKLYRKVHFRGYEAPPASVAKVKKFLSDRNITQPIVTLTVRYQEFEASRNSIIDSYFQFAEFLVSNGFSPIFIPDADYRDAVNFGDYVICIEACDDMYFRCALYEQAVTNIFKANGTHALAALNHKCNFIMFNDFRVYPDNNRARRIREHGVAYIRQPFEEKPKFFVGEDENIDNMMRYFYRTLDFCPKTSS